MTAVRKVWPAAVTAVLGLIVAHAHADEPSSASYRWYAIPNFAYDTDNGIGFGVRGELLLDAPNHVPYETAFVVHLFATTRGYHHHRFRFDRTGLGPQGRLRLTAHLAWRQWLNDGYWGLGNTTARDSAFVGSFESGDPRRTRYRYSLFQPFLHVTLRADIGRPWSLVLSANPKYSVVRAPPGSLVESQRPYGINGGFATVLSAGVVYDTREPETSPVGGTAAELSLRLAPRLDYDLGTYWGAFFAWRRYTELLDGLVLAHRIMIEHLWGDVPFYEMVHWGGWAPIAGFGGADTVRGMSFGRYHARGKAVANLELRIEIADTHLNSSPLQLEIVPFADAGMVFGSKGSLVDPWTGLPFHPTAGLGGRAIYDKDFVGRIDTAFGLDSIRDEHGEIRDVPVWGFYVVFDHMF